MKRAIVGESKHDDNMAAENLSTAAIVAVFMSGDYESSTINTTGISILDSMGSLSPFAVVHRGMEQSFSCNFGTYSLCWIS